MSTKRDRKHLKTYFETGDRPTEGEFIEFIDSMIIQQEDQIWIDATDVTKKVGIGTQTPSKKLDVNGDTHVSGTITVEGHIFGDKSNKPDTEDLLLLDNGANIQMYGKRYPNRAGDLFLIGDKRDNGSGKIVFSQHLGPNSWRNNMTIDTNGNVGIGINTPQNKLHLENSGQDNTGLRLTGQNGWQPGQVLMSDANGNAKWVDKSEVTNSLWKANGNNIHNGNAGNVGIGITNPTEKLELAGTLSLRSGNIKGNKDSETLALFTNSTGFNGPSILLNGKNMNDLAERGAITFVANNSHQPQGTSANPNERAFSFVTNGETYNWHSLMAIKKNGNVGIGTHDPAYKLDVNGSTNIRGNVTVNGFVPMIRKRYTIEGSENTTIKDITDYPPSHYDAIIGGLQFHDFSSGVYLNEYFIARIDANGTSGWRIEARFPEDNQSKNMKKIIDILFIRKELIHRV